MRKHVRMMAILAAAALGACKDNDPTGATCPELPRPVVIVRVVDAGSGLPAADEATGSVTEGASTWPLFPYGADRLAPRVTDRPGIYTVTVQKTGYNTWVRTGVQVQADECGAETVQLDAFLVPG